jgi:hypothetical protein
MRYLSYAVAVCLFASALGARQSTKRIFLSPKSTVASSRVAEGLAKDCPSVVLTGDERKADYVLEGAETVTTDRGSVYRHWHFALMSSSGDVLMTTDRHFEDVCKFIDMTK